MVTRWKRARCPERGNSVSDARATNKRLATFWDNKGARLRAHAERLAPSKMRRDLERESRDAFRKAEGYWDALRELRASGRA